MDDIKIKTIDITKPDDMNFILGQTHFIKSAEDIYEAIINSAAGAKCGIAFSEASGDCKIRLEGNDKELVDLAKKNMQNIAAGHSFIVFLKDCFPLNVLNSIQNIPEVCNIFCATANHTKVIVAESETGRGILGVIDGFKPKGVETVDEKKWRKKFLRDIGYKL